MRLARLPRAGIAAYALLVAGVTVLGAAGLLPRWPGLVHLVALPPLDLAADLRWLLARAPGHPSFVAGVVAALAVRVSVLALLLGGGRSPRWRLAAGLYGGALLPLLLAAQLDFVARTALYSRLFGASLLVLAATVVALGAAAWTLEPRAALGVRRAATDGFRILDLLAYAVVLLGLGAVAELLGPAGSVALVPAVGLATLVTMRRLLAPAPAHGWAHLGVVVLVGVTLFAAVVSTRGVPWAVSDAQRDGSVMVMSGINSASGEGAIFELEPERIGFACDQMFYYSYAGTGTGQPRGAAACPIRTGAPYEPEDTQRPFAEQVELLEAQVEPLEEPVTILAHSQAAWVAWQAAAEDRLEGVTRLVLVSPFPSSPLGFPPPGDAGPGRVGGDGFRLLEPVIDLADFDFTVDAPLTHEMLATPDAAEEVFAQPLPGDPQVLAVTTTPDVALMPDGWRIEGATDSCPLREAHPYLPITPGFHRVVDRFLDGERGGDGCPPWPELYRVTTQALGTPPQGA